MRILILCTIFTFVWAAPPSSLLWSDGTSSVAQEQVVLGGDEAKEESELAYWAAEEKKWQELNAAQIEDARVASLTARDVKEDNEGNYSEKERLEQAFWDAEEQKWQELSEAQNLEHKIASMVASYVKSQPEEVRAAIEESVRAFWAAEKTKWEEHNAAELPEIKTAILAANSAESHVRSYGLNAAVRGLF